MYKRFSFLLGIFIHAASLHAQDPHFSQYNLARIYTNPAAAGSDSTLNLAVSGRLQWPKIGGGYTTENFSADNYFRCLHGGLGINLMHDDAMGFIKTTRAGLSYAAHMELFRHKLAVQAGIELGYFQKSADWSKLTFGDMIDERRGFDYPDNEFPQQSKKAGIDLSAGLLLYSKQFYGGFAAHHLNEPDEGFLSPSRLPVKLSVYAGANAMFVVNSASFILSPNLLFMQQQDFRELMPGLTVKCKKVVLGLSYRSEDAFIITAGLQFPFLKLGYSYDYTVSTLTNEASGGAHELQLTFYIHASKKAKALSLRMI
ncbi:MAG: hypothetical protein JWO09_1125 [Bacteroidetes bacterium]|nr:hypothetical protein [Bacteroidota bacterium]